MMSAFTWDQETPVLNVRTGIPYLAIPIGAILFALHCVLIARDFVEKRFEHVDDLEAFAE
jgi:TRAP-type C4-dicarboxylate transport system permease small subunit